VVQADQTPVDLHDALQAAFGWDNDHLHAFWLNGEFWSREGAEYVHPLRRGRRRGLTTSA
jgi:hypothetical protein